MALQRTPATPITPSAADLTQAVDPAVLEEVKRKYAELLAAQAAQAAPFDEPADEEIPYSPEQLDDSDVETENESTEVALRQNTSVVVTTGHRAMAMAEYDEIGFSGLIMDARSIPIIGIKNGRFEDMDGNDMGLSMKGKVLNSFENFAFSARKAKEGHMPELTDCTFSKDGVVDHKGESIQDWVEAKTDAGFTVVKRDYTHVVVLMDAPGHEYDQELRVWSIPTTSRGRFAGKLRGFEVVNRLSAGNLNEALSVTNCIASVGAQVTNKAQNKYNPWAFTFEKLPKEFAR